jgi:hypothetical protein
VSAEENLQRAEELLERLEQARARLEATTDQEAAIEILAEVAETARGIEAALSQAMREADAQS